MALIYNYGYTASSVKIDRSNLTITEANYVDF